MNIKGKLLSDALGLNISKYDAHDDPVFQVMKIRKGKKIIARALSFFSPVSKNSCVLINFRSWHSFSRIYHTFFALENFAR